MASLEQINYQPHRAEISDGSLEWAALKRKPIKNLPQILWEDNSTWAEANLWALDQATSSKWDLKTVRSNMSHLLAYAKWLEAESILWWHFPERESERCLVRFRGALVAARNNGDLAPSTASQRMAAVIRFYKWTQARRLISPEWPMWGQRFVGIKLTNPFGLEHTMRVASTDLAIPNRKVAGAIQLEDGLLPVTVSAMKEILALADRSATEELSLMLRIGFFTGLRIGSITDLKVQTLHNATMVPEVGWKRLPERLIPVRCWHLSLLLVFNGGTMTLLEEEIRQLETRLAQLEQMLAEVARQSLGLYLAAVGSRHFASWFGLTPKEHSSARQGESSCNCYSTGRQ